MPFKVFKSHMATNVTKVSEKLVKGLKLTTFSKSLQVEKCQVSDSRDKQIFIYVDILETKGPFVCSANPQDTS